jgi:Rrf2 family protein
MNNIHFATTLHILTMLAITKDNLSSTHIADSININPSMVRKSISLLRAHGLIETKEGKGGGASLAKSADEILLSDIYRTVNDVNLLGKLNSPNPKCNTGKQINTHLLDLFNLADEALIGKLGTVTLADFCHKFK